MNAVTEFAKQSVTASPYLSAAFLLVLVGQFILWSCRVFAKDRYWLWVLRRRWLREICCDPYSDHPVRLLLLGNVLTGIKILVRKPTPEVEAALLSALNSSSQELRKGAINALGLVGSDGATLPLIKQLSAREIQPFASAALVKLSQSNPRMAESLTDALNGSDRDAAVAEVLVAMKAFDNLSAALPGLTNHSAAEVTIRALGKSGHPVDARTVAALQRHEDEGVCLATMAALQQLRSPEAFGYLVALLHKPWPQVRIAAIADLTELRDSRAVAPLLELLTDVEPSVRAKAVSALATFRDPSTVKPLIRGMLYDRTNFSDYVGALGRIPGVPAVAPLTAFLLYANASKISEIKEIVQALRAIGGPEAVQSLLMALRLYSGDSKVQKILTGGLIELRGELSSEDRDTLDSMMNSAADYESLRSEDLRALIQWIVEAGDLECEYVPPVYRQESIYGLYGEFQGVETVVQNKGKVRLIRR
jgi:HEAT repeat protein